MSASGLYRPGSAHGPSCDLLKFKSVAARHRTNFLLSQFKLRLFDICLLILVTASSSTTLTTTTITTNNHDATNNRKFVFNILFVNMFLNFLTVRLYIWHKHEPVSLPLQPQQITTSCHVTTSPHCQKATNDEQCHRDTYANEWENSRGSRHDASQAPGILFYFVIFYFYYTNEHFKNNYTDE
jgi:hypothetical protein